MKKSTTTEREALERINARQNAANLFTNIGPADIAREIETMNEEQKEEVTPAPYTITHNNAYNSTEISFSGKPAEPIREALKALKFRWHRQRRVWYGHADEQTARAAIEAADTPATTDAAKPAKQDHIRIYYNGLKIYGGKLIRCFYSLDNDCTVRGECVSISARDYDDLPRDLLPVTNDTDTYTDYFDSDRATITPAHPLYRYFRYAAMKSEARDNVRYCERLRQQLNSGRREPWPGHFDTLRRDLETREAQIAAFGAMTDPGQPTAADLEAIDKRRQEAENARREAEHAAELAERERVLRERNEGRRLIEATAAAHPIEADAPAVVIRWSEHPAFSAYDDDALKLSIAAADKIFQALDLKQHNTRDTDTGHGWYYKTKFRIIGTDPDGEEIDYEGRFDIGDGEGGLINHIRNWGEWCRTHDAINRELDHPADTNDILQFADYLEQFTA